ncbi:MAG: hypothetical protein R3A45_08740 [Bdellovibrionota bacterium]
MFLFYFDYFTDGIIRNIKPHNDTKNTAYHQLLSAMVERLTDWAELLEHEKPNQKNTQLENTHASHQNGNIPKSALICLVSVVQKIAVSSKLNDKFKNEMFQYTFHLYFMLNHFNADYAKTLAVLLKEGGTYLNSQIAQLYYEELHIALQEIDSIVYGFDKVKEFKRLVT